MPTIDNPNNTGPKGLRRWVAVWSGNEYDAIRDSWTNADLLAAIPSKL